MGQQVGTEPDLLLEVNDFTLIFPSFLEMVWLTAWEKEIPLFVNTKSISRLTELSLTVFLLGEQGLQSATGDGTGAHRGPVDGKSAFLSAAHSWCLEAGSSSRPNPQIYLHQAFLSWLEANPVCFPLDCVRGISLCE